MTSQGLSGTPVIAVISGKGGVGKTSVSVALARALRNAGYRIGLLDADLSGPDIPRMLGLRRDAPAKSVTVARWVRGPQAQIEAMEVDGIKVASVGFLMGGDQMFSAGGDIDQLMLGRLLAETDWGRVDALVVDMPPGAGDIHRALRGRTGALAAIVVVTPAEVSHLDSSRALTMLEVDRVPVLGGVENMAFLACPCCGEQSALYPAAPEERTVWAKGVRRLVSLPFRPGTGPVDDDLSDVVKAAAEHIGPPDPS
ncbi:ATP-binding protein involved in chromosome partitioning [Actinacidiphila yanglinensis]|uniref:ATP-binding protein involved in chromosome partitioning n=1 Tax=Actinacidiphila yanglinensis TaxID=310779 RepID=A0A1H6CT43_9ACTN|nr:Mrp/NBP35 family ATP-binding protein [Actinacidiphila yanglinensis]SEG75755.1 ATP-binding protein involved in chromosome partitioning [Actinacidiphila yanglinensis]